MTARQEPEWPGWLATVLGLTCNPEGASCCAGDEETRAPRMVASAQHRTPAFGRVHIFENPLDSETLDNAPDTVRADRNAQPHGTYAGVPVRARGRTSSSSTVEQEDELTAERRELRAQCSQAQLQV